MISCQVPVRAVEWPRTCWKDAQSLLGYSTREVSPHASSCCCHAIIASFVACISSAMPRDLSARLLAEIIRRFNILSTGSSCLFTSMMHRSAFSGGWKPASTSLHFASPALRFCPSASVCFLAVSHSEGS
jgi:hypothetical protein